MQTQRVFMSRDEGIAFDRLASAHGRRMYGMRAPDERDRARVRAVLNRLADAGNGAILVYHAGPPVSDEDLDHVVTRLAPAFTSESVPGLALLPEDTPFSP